MQASKMTNVTGCSSPFPASWLSSVLGGDLAFVTVQSHRVLGQAALVLLGDVRSQIAPCSPALPG